VVAAAAVVGLAVVPTPASGVVRDIEDACPRGLPAAFFDVDPTATHARGIDCVAHWQVALGGRDGYGPTGAVPRAQMASFVARLITVSGGALPAEPPDAFDDDKGSTHEGAINALAAAGVVSGKGPRRFGPADLVTRDQMTTFLVKAFETRTGTVLPDGPDAFDDDNSSVHRRNIDRAAAAGFAAGTGTRQFTPFGTVRRDQMATFLARVLDRLVEERFSVVPTPPPTYRPGGYGPATSGATPAQVEAPLTRAGLVKAQDLLVDDCRLQSWTSRPTGPADLWFERESQRLFLVGTGEYWGEGPGGGRSRTDRGIGLRSSEQQLREAYPEAQQRRFDIQHFDPGRGYLVTDGSGQALAFAVSEAGVVIGMGAGPASVFEQIALCS